jgi:SAM-dependent MidA family methyltransferase
VSRVTADSLPALSASESEHSRALLTRIRAEIESHGGWISFARFMEMALYEPGLGYYSAGAAKFGGAGDFVTAPEISPLFSRCLAAQCAEVLAALGGGDILELGAGSGVMAADLLAELEALGQLPRRYLILELSADLRQRQLELLADRAARHLDRIVWLETLPRSLTGLIVANEVLDAVPVERFRVRGDKVNALGVTWHGQAPDWSEVRARRELAIRVRALERYVGARFANGYTSEINLRHRPLIASLAEALTSGVMLFIDYGLPRRQYYRPERHDGTLLCHFRHRFHDDPFAHVGLQDIGAWVDFTEVAEAATHAGLEVAGFTTQAHFLMGSGIERYLAAVTQAQVAERVHVARQAMLLTLPAEMGERFKAIALTRGYERPLSGFAIRDLAASL